MVSTTDSNSSVCERISERLAEQVGRNRYGRLFGDSAGLRLDGDTLNLHVRDSFLADWIGRHFGDVIRRAAQDETGNAVQLQIRVHPSESDAPVSREHTRRHAADHEAERPARKGDDTRPAPAARGDDRARAHRPHSPTDAPPRRAPQAQPDHRYRLDTFVLGQTNRLAHRAAIQAAESQTARDLNPLFVYGTCGVGKTHLMHGILHRHRDRQTHLKRWYTTGEQFTNDYIAALKTGRIEAFRRRLRKLDLLCIDDVHFLSNKHATQAELLHTLKAIDLNGARLILASDEHPHQIRRFTDRLVSHFMSGMVVQIDRPDVSMREELISVFADRRGLRLDRPVVAALARRFTNSPRELEGALMKLEAVHRLLGPSAGSTFAPAQVGMHCYHRAFDGSNTAPRKPIRVDDIIERVCDRLHVDISDVLGRSRHRRVVAARSLAAYLARDLTTLSFPELADRMSRPNHSTIVTACQRVARLIKEGAQVYSGRDGANVPIEALADELKREILNHAGRA